MKIFQEMAEEWWFEKKYDMARDRLRFPALKASIIIFSSFPYGEVMIPDVLMSDMLST